MRLYTNVWVECNGVDNSDKECPNRGVMNPPVELVKLAHETDDLEREHYLINEDSLYAKLREVDWVCVARGHFICPKCAKDAGLDIGSRVFAPARRR